MKDEMDDEVNTAHLIKILLVNFLHQLVDHDGVFPVVSQEALVRELVEPRDVARTAGLSLPLVEEEIVPLGLDSALHHLLQVTDGHLRSRKKRYFKP